MSLVACRKCGNQISHEATHCPKCNTPTAQAEMGKCRSCGKELEVDKYMSLSTSTYVVDGTTQSTPAITTFSPCPYCGAPEALRGTAAGNKYKLRPTRLALVSLIGIPTGVLLTMQPYSVLLSVIGYIVGIISGAAFLILLIQLASIPFAALGWVIAKVFGLKT